MVSLAPETFRSMGLTDEEFSRIVHLMGREPTLTELGMFAVMWSEHCGYKYSKAVLSRFKRYKRSLEGDGFENAGVVDIGDGIGVTMKIESHNHPSAVEPYQGAATGVGGIIRDIFTMGARPIASLNSLRFGPISDGEAPPEVLARNRYLFEGVVSGIAGYGNCVGVPTVGGEVSFHPRYSGNPLVNAMCIGIVRIESIATAAAAGVGNAVVYLGSSTGKDGIHGATFASEVLGEDSQAKRPNVQIGDPFAEKLLIEATLEALETGSVAAIQDMGAAGLTCSTVEMSSKGGVGMDIDLDLVPAREPGMSAYELMLSESQERMLAVAHKGREQELIDVFRKWGLHAAVIGHVNETGIVTIKRYGRIEAQVVAKHLTDECPVYSLPAQAPDYYERAKQLDLSKVPIFDPKAALLKLLRDPSLGSKRWVWQQFDQQVQTQTVGLPGASEAAVLAPRGTRKGIAAKIDGNARHVYFDPYVGALAAVAEAARNVACAGAKPVAITDGLNFGNPQLPHVYWQFSEAVRGIADAAEALETPVISGNVSFYNESEIGEVLPTPLIGMLGVIEDAGSAIPSAPSGGEGVLLLLSTAQTSSAQLGLGASAYLATVCGIEDGLPERPELEQEKALCALLVDLVASKLLLAAHDCSEGGLLFVLAEIAAIGGCGIDASIESSLPRLDAQLFGELPGRVIVAAAPALVNRVVQSARSQSIECVEIGSYDQSGTFLVRYNGGKIEENVRTLQKVYEESLNAVCIGRLDK